MTGKLIAVTKPQQDNLSVEQLIAYMAKVSNPTNQDNLSNATKLLGYLIKNNHWLPFEMVHLVIEIECTRAIGRQILRHRSFSFQEFSQRYAQVDASMFTKVECRMQDTKNRQNSIKSDGPENVMWDVLQREMVAHAMASYKIAIDAGIAKEQARVFLPEGLTMSRMYMAGSLRSWIHYCSLRSGNGTQKEHQLIAKNCWKIIVGEFPSLQNLFTSIDINDLVEKDIEKVPCDFVSVN